MQVAEAISEWVCAQCGQAFTRSGVVRRRPRYCSKSCYGKAYMPKWREGNAEHVALYASDYDATHKEERRESNRRYAADHPEVHRIWAANHRDAVNASARRSYWKNHERALETMRDWHRRNAERKSIYSREWRLGNGAAYRAINNAWHQTEKGKAHSRRGRAKRRSVMVDIRSTLSAEQWAATLAYYQYACCYCGSVDKPLTQEHRIPISRGGHHEFGNVIPACGPCNSSKGNRLPGEWKGRMEARYEVN